MTRSKCLLLFAMACSVAFFSAAGYARQSDKDAAQKPAEKKPDPNQKKKSDRKLMKELDTPYKKWLQEDVIYIITDDERKAFLQLSTNEEREQFIEQFWLRRDPTPDTVENEFKEEHYRRIAYANEHFASGIPGWRTDRGRIYIIHGKPDEIESHPTGGSYERPIEEGGGNTSTYAFEKWRYRYIEGIGNDVNLEFVDPSGSGEYRLTMDPSEKDALLMVPGAGLTFLESVGQASKVDRFNRTDGTHLGKSSFTPASMGEFERMELFAKIQQPPAVKFKDLEEVVTFRLLRNQINFDYRFDFLRVTGNTVQVPITLQIPNKQLTFQDKQGIHSAVINIFGRVTTLTGRVVQTFEDVVNRDIADSLLKQTLKGNSIYQKSVPLSPGLYRLDLVVKDVQSGNVGAVNTRLAVPRYDEEKLSTSTMILADQIEPVPAKQIGYGPFVIGSSKVRPRMDATFSPTDRLGVYLQIYNLNVDEKTHKSDVTVQYRITSGEKELLKQTETAAQLGQTGQQLTLERLLPVSHLAPGRYTIEIQITDNITKQVIKPSAEFTVKAAEATAAKN
jgi:GWxTD domain-containing protein